MFCFIVCHVKLKIPKELGNLSALTDLRLNGAQPDAISENGFVIPFFRQPSMSNFVLNRGIE